MKKLLADAHKCLSTELLPALDEAGIHILDYAELERDAAARGAQQYFDETVFPVLTPLAFDPGRPFPHISNLSLNLAVLIRDRDGRRAFRARQGARFAAATGAGDRVASEGETQAAAASASSWSGWNR